MKKENSTSRFNLLIYIVIAIVLYNFSKSCRSSLKEARNDPRTKERIEQEREDLNNRLLDKHFEEDARRKR